MYYNRLFPYDEEVKRELDSLHRRSERRAQMKAKKRKNIKRMVGNLYMRLVLILAAVALAVITVRAIIPTVVSAVRFADGVVSAEYPDGEIRISTYDNYVVGSTVYRTYTPVYESTEFSYDVVVGALK